MRRKMGRRVCYNRLVSVDATRRGQRAGEFFYSVSSCCCSRPTNCSDQQRRRIYTQPYFKLLDTNEGAQSPRFSLGFLENAGLGFFFGQGGGEMVMRIDEENIWADSLPEFTKMTQILIRLADYSLYSFFRVIAALLKTCGTTNLNSCGYPS